MQRITFSTALFQHSSHYLHYLRRKYTVTPVNKPSLKNVNAMPCAMHKFLMSSASSILSSTKRPYGRVPVASCRNMGSIQHSLVDYTVTLWQKRMNACIGPESCSPCTLAVLLLAWHFICHTSEVVLFRPTNDNPQRAVFGANKVRRNVTYLKSVHKVVHLQVSALTILYCIGYGGNIFLCMKQR